jgi:hypothetical protein
MTLTEHRAELERIRAARQQLAIDMGQQRATRALNRAERASVADTGALLELVAAIEATPNLGEYFDRDEELYRQAKVHADAINAQVRASQQRKANKEQAARTHAASCGRCFTVHAGHCW